MSDLVGNPEDQFSHNEAQIMLLIWSAIAVILLHRILAFYTGYCFELLSKAKSKITVV